MRKATKRFDSEILNQGLRYIPGNSAHNRKIASILLEEQKHFCAYTDEYISRTDAADIEHFDPTLKGNVADNYGNWFLVKHQWNKEKAYKWDGFQPLLHPTAADFEERVVYLQGDYVVKSDTDLEAKNLIRLLRLDDAALADKRKRYIKRKRMEMGLFGEGAFAFFSTLASTDACQVSYSRAIREEFGIDVLDMTNDA